MSTEGRKTTTEGFGIRDRRAGLSCAECRRSKLKCDRVFPCQSCIRRGCAEICPDGTLAATKGNKVLVAHAQRLTEQVKTLSTRIRELEAALIQTQGDEIHPLLRTPLSSDVEGEILDFHAIYEEAGPTDVSSAIGSLSIGSDGRAKYHGETAGSEYFQDLLPLTDEDWRGSGPKHLGLPFEIIDLMNSFPFGLKDCPYTKLIFVPFLPSRERAVELADLYYRNVAWMYDPIVQQDFITTILDPIYGATGITNLDTLHSHRLAVFFILIASGFLYDSHPSAPIMADQCHALARAAFSLDSILQEATCATVQAMFMIIRFIYNSDRAGYEARWLLTGLCARLAQTIGLQRDSSGWNLEPEEVQRRRRMFWELCTYDAWGSVVNGRPPALMIRHTDCQFPDDLDPSVKPSGEVEMGWHAWKFRYTATCLSTSIQHVFTNTVPSYAALVDLDKKIRKFPLPTHLRCPIEGSEMDRAWSPDPSRAMQQYCVLCERESNLLYIHRSYFAQAIREDSKNPLRHKYAFSVQIVYTSAFRMISSLKSLYPKHIDPVRHCWFFWSGIFSSCVVLGALVVDSPGCTLASEALRELQSTVPFYEEGSRPCRPPASYLTMLQKLQQRAYSTFVAFHSGVDANRKPPNNRGSPDELEVLGGRKSVIKDKSNSNSPSSNVTSASPSHLYRDSSEESSLSSQPGSSDTGMEYYEESGNGAYDVRRGWDREMKAATASFVGEPSPYPPPTQSTQTLVDHYLGNPASPSAPQQPQQSMASGLSEGGIEFVHGPSQGRRHPPTGYASMRQAPYHHEHPHSASSLHHPNMPGAPQQMEIGQHAVAFGHQGQEQNQDEIWRHFIREFGLESLP